jgi:glutathione peroxidase
MFTMVDASSEPSSVYDIQVKTIDGKDISLSDYRGKVLLVVNVASRCGYTSQYAGLQQLYTKYNARGFEVLGFPSNDFGGQEPGSEAEIKSFCSNSFGVTFPLFSKVAVIGAAQHPLYHLLTSKTGGAPVSWNFEKFLIDRTGSVIQRYPSRISPSDEALVAALEGALGGL